MFRTWLWVIALALIAIAWPPQWYPESVRIKLTQWFGASDYRPLPTAETVDEGDGEDPCPIEFSAYRQPQDIEGVTIRPESTCVADNPYTVAAVVRGTNNVSAATLMESGLTVDAVEKGADLDGDGDPDEIHIRLEIAELNGGSGEIDDPTVQYALAPGIKPGLWVFAPKLVGMATENFESLKARPQLRLPSPAIRVEQGDSVKVTLENSHYMPHTIHLHGADHGFVDASGEGNDGVPIASEQPVLPGGARTYELQPRQSGTMFYHCHVQPHVHVMMGLQGLFIVEENRPDNWLQTLNIGAGLVRAPSVAVQEQYDAEYDLHYLDLDIQLSDRLRSSNDPRQITKSMHRDYDITDAQTDLFTLNGRSFPYTFRESLLITEADQNTKLRVVNGGMKGIALHTHGHKFTVTHRDGVPLPEPMQSPQDVVWLPTAQRVDLNLTTRNDGRSSYGPGIWLFHDHQNRGVTNDGIGPGGNISAIVYGDYLGADGWPKTQGVSWDPYFTEAYYKKELPIWQSYAPGLFNEPGSDPWMILRVLALGLAFGMMVALALSGTRRS